MRRILSIIALMCFVSLSSFSQVSRKELIEMRNKFESLSNSYLTVKGIPLKPGLKMDDLFKQFIAKGWKKSEYFDIFKKDDGTFLLEGTFFGYDKCKIYIIPMRTDKDIVSVVGISFPDVNSFKEVKKTYDDLKASLEEKYKIEECTEKFDNEFVGQSTSDNLKFSAIRNNEATFKTEFHLRESASILMGRIILSIVSINNESTHVSLSYVTSDDVIEELTGPKPEDDL